MTIIGIFFGALLVAAAVGMAKIQRRELIEARAAKEAQKTRLEAFRAKRYRPDGD